MKTQIFDRINNSKNKALKFIDSLKVNEGYKYTVNHDYNIHPSAILYGTWSAVFLNKLVNNLNNSSFDKLFALNTLKSFRQKDGTFFPKSLKNSSYTKSFEYMLLHIYNYSVGACMMVDLNFDFQSKYLDHFLDPDHLNKWLNQRSLQRPWEESNNIVNVASYLALCNDNGNSLGKERLLQMFEWHNDNQNKKTGGFDNFTASKKNILQSMAGAVHNFHIHHYLNEPMNYEKLIGKNLIPFLYEGPLTACLSIDFVELGCYVLPYLEEPYELQQALLFHLDSLLKYQNDDGGWYENETLNRPTIAAGMKEKIASSNSYATWFRMCSIGMISISLLGDTEKNWNFRNTLGMGYYKQKTSPNIVDFKIDKINLFKNWKNNIPYKIKNQIIQLGSNILNN